MNGDRMKRIARSLLFVPGHRSERFPKAIASGAHAVVLDLEDAVAPDAKSGARDAVANWLSTGTAALVRINAAETEWFEDDLAMLGAFSNAGVMLSKADSLSLSHTADALKGREVVALLESVDGYVDLSAMSTIVGLSRIAFGSVDFALDSGIFDEADALTSIRNQIVLQSRIAGLAAPVDGVGVDFSDPLRMNADALRSRQLGFGGKLCIHPAQVGAVNAAFEPSERDRDWAARVLHAFEVSRGAATSVDGKMIDKPVVERARRIAAEFESVAPT